MQIRILLGSMAAACLALAACRAPAPQAVPAADDGGRIVGLYRALEALDGGRARAPVVMLQIGDSHTETDAFSGRMRELLQARFGAGGRGPLPPGVPTRWHRPQQVAVSASPEWRMAGARPGPLPDGVVIGMSGVSAAAETPDAVMTLVATGEAGFDTAAVEVMAQPGGGTLEARVDDGPPFRIATTAGVARAAWHDVPAPPGGRTLALRAYGDGPVSLLMWSVARAAPGVVYANLGIVGATVGVLDRWDSGAVAAEAAALRPTLLLVAFGTNEGFDATLDGAAYRDGFAQRLARLRAAIPGAAIVVIGPPDGNQAMARRRGRRLAAAGCVTDGSTDVGWMVPRNLAVVRAAQRSIAEENGWLFWDWAAAMGGACSMDRLVQADPPLAWPDHVHLRDAGYRLMAEALFAELMRGYDQYRAARRPAG